MPGSDDENSFKDLMASQASEGITPGQGNPPGYRVPEQDWIDQVAKLKITNRRPSCSDR